MKKGMVSKADYLLKENRKYGLLLKDIDFIISILSANPKIEKIVLFGSRAKGNFNKGSDIDIAIKGQQLNLDDIVESKIKIDELSLPYKFDIIIYDRINEPDLIGHIDRVGKILFRR